MHTAERTKSDTTAGRSYWKAQLAGCGSEA